MEGGRPLMGREEGWQLRERRGGGRGNKRERVELVFSFQSLLSHRGGFFTLIFFMSCEQNSWRICKIRTSLQLMLKSHNWGPESSHRCGNFLLQVVLRTDLCDKGSTYLVYRIIWRRRRRSKTPKRCSGKPSPSSGHRWERYKSPTRLPL